MVADIQMQYNAISTTAMCFTVIFLGHCTYFLPDVASCHILYHLCDTLFLDTASVTILKLCHLLLFFSAAFWRKTKQKIE